MTKESIPSKLRINVWNTYEGAQNKIGTCMCCSNSIEFENFHCGHVVAEKNGGEMIIENLRPICANCNLSMQTLDMIEYIKTNKLKLNPNFCGYKDNNDVKQDDLKIDELKIICTCLDLPKNGTKQVLLQKVIEKTGKTAISDILNELTCTALRQLCENRKISKSGTKEKLILNLMENFNPNADYSTIDLDKVTMEINEKCKNSKKQPKILTKDKLHILQIFGIEVSNEKNTSKIYNTEIDSEQFEHKDALRNLLNQTEILKKLSESDISDVHETMHKKNKKITKEDMIIKIGSDKMFYSKFIIKKMSKLNIRIVKKICDNNGIKKINKKTAMIYSLIVDLFSKEIDKININNLINDEIIELIKASDSDKPERAKNDDVVKNTAVDDDKKNNCDDTNCSGSSDTSKKNTDGDNNGSLNHPISTSIEEASEIISANILEKNSRTTVSFDIKNFEYKGNHYELCGDELHMNGNIIEHEEYMEAYRAMVDEDISLQICAFDCLLSDRKKE